jgi:hypothetical protein
MKRSITTALLGAFAVSAALAGLGCSAVQQLSGAAANLRNLQFQLGDVNGFRLNGVDISRIQQPSDVSPADLLRLGQAIASKTLPVEFTLNVLAKNPNTPGAGTSTATPLYLSRLDWRLKIDGRETVNGTVNKRLEIPGNGQTTTIPLSIGLDLYKFFGDRGLSDLVNLAVTIGGARGSSSNLELLAKVTVDIPLIGQYTYPNEISIVNRQFSNP